MRDIIHAFTHHVCLISLSYFQFMYMYINFSCYLIAFHTHTFLYKILHYSLSLKGFSIPRFNRSISSIYLFPHLFISSFISFLSFSFFFSLSIIVANSGFDSDVRFAKNLVRCPIDKSNRTSGLYIFIHFISKK